MTDPEPMGLGCAVLMAVAFLLALYGLWRLFWLVLF